MMKCSKFHDHVGGRFFDILHVQVREQCDIWCLFDNRMGLSCCSYRYASIKPILSTRQYVIIVVKGMLVVAFNNIPHVESC